MNIELLEPEYTRDQARCCGGILGDYETRKAIALRRARKFPEKQIVVTVWAACEASA